MTPTREPVIWVSSITGLLSAAAVAGLIQQDDADRFGPLVAVGVPFLFLVANTAAALVIRMRTAPVAAGTEKVQVLTLSDDGLYRRPGEAATADAQRAQIRRHGLQNRTGS